MGLETDADYGGAEVSFTGAVLAVEGKSATRLVFKTVFCSSSSSRAGQDRSLD